MSNRVPVATIARLYSEGHTSLAIVNALYREAGVRLSRHDIDAVVQGLLRQQTAMKALPPPPALPDFIPQLSPKFTPPRHLKPFTDLFEQIGKRPMRVVGHAPPRHSKCQPAGSPVLLTDGRSVPIEKVRRGDRVVTLLADRTLGESVVTDSGSNRVKPVLRLHLYSGRTIDCTENHPLLTVHGWRESAELREGQSIATARELPCPDGKPLPKIFESIPDGWRELMKTTPHWLRKNHGLRVDKKYTHGTARMLVQQVADIEDNAALRELCAPALAWERITKIEHLGEVPTYGIAVKKTKNYISGGIISHNTETILHAVAHVLRKDPSLLCGYSTYAMDLTFSKSVHARELAQKAGVKLARKAAKEWRTIDGGGLLATSTGGPLTGHGISGAMFIDDAYKNRVQAESKNIRNTIWDWFSDVVMTRLEPGASVFILMTRWHQDDLGGRALRELGKHKRGPEGQRYCALDCPGCGPNPIDGFEEIRLPAIDDFGNSLWPERWPLEALEARRREVTAYTWFSLYQGIPRARGTNVFSGLTFYDPEQMPAAGFRIAIGIDLSYTESTSADWAVAVVLMKYGSEYWVLEVVREQTTAPKFALKLKDLRKRYKRAPMFSIFYGPEKGSIDFMRTLGVPIKGLKRPGDKFVRSQPTAAKWNAGKILVPHVTEEASDHLLVGGKKTCAPECRGCRWPWLPPFVEVVTGFTGVKDDCDDDVDALVAAVEGMPETTQAIIETVQVMVNTRPLPNLDRRDPRDRSGGFGPADI